MNGGVRLAACVMCAVVLAAACGDDGQPAADSSLPVVDANGTADARLGDARVHDARVDAFVPCFGQQLFTGEYVDWDSTPKSFLGIPDTTVAEVGNETNSVTTAPNGRAILCLNNGVNADVSFTHTDYLPLMFSAHADVTTRGNGYSTKGLKPTRATQLASELGLGALSGTQVLVEVRNMNTGAAGVGVTVGLVGQTVGAAYAMDAAHQWSPGDVVLAGGFVLFTNVADTNGEVTLSVSPAASETCTARTTVTLQDGGIAATSVHCE